jgi:hypothetical protein
MDNLREQKKEALQAVDEYLQKLIPGMGTLCGELRGNRQSDTDVFLNQCVDGLNWVIEAYNRASDVMEAERIHNSKQEMNERLVDLGTAIRDKEDGKIAEILEHAVVPFLKDLSEAIEQSVGKAE